MKVVLISADGSIYGYVGLNTLPGDAGQQIPDVLTVETFRTFVLQPRESFPPEVRWNCEAVFKESISAFPATPVYKEKVDGLILSAIAACLWLGEQEREVELVDSPFTERTIDNAESLLSFEFCNPPNEQAWHDLKHAVLVARQWKHPGSYTFNEVSKTWVRGCAQPDFSKRTT